MLDEQNHPPRVDLSLAKLNGYVCESAILIASAHKILGIMHQALKEVNDSQHADYLLTRISEWQTFTAKFAEDYGKIGNDITLLKRTCSQ